MGAIKYLGAVWSWLGVSSVRRTQSEGLKVPLEMPGEAETLKAGFLSDAGNAARQEAGLFSLWNL